MCKQGTGSLNDTVISNFHLTMIETADSNAILVGSFAAQVDQALRHQDLNGIPYMPPA
jgi:hypothetical protein